MFRAARRPRARIVGRSGRSRTREATMEAGRRATAPSSLSARRETAGFRIEGAAAESEGVDGQVLRNYTGPGCVSANSSTKHHVYSSNTDPGVRGYAGPDFQAAVADPDGLTNIERMSRAFRRPARVVGCSGSWVQLEYVRMGRLGPNRIWRDFPVRQRAPARAWFRSGNPGE